MQPMTPALAARSDLAPRARQLLAAQLVDCGQLLEMPLRGVLDDLEHELFRIAEQSSGGQAQHEALEGLRETRRTRSGFQAYLTALIEQRFAATGETDPNGAAPTVARAGEDMALVDPREFDETMALGDLSTRLELHVSNALFELGHRYAVLVASPPLEPDALPCGPHALAQALGEAVHTLGLGRDHRLLFYRLCDRRLSTAADALYAHLNRQLQTAGILPHLKSYLPRHAAAAPRSRDANTNTNSDTSGDVSDAADGTASVARGPMAAITDFSPQMSTPVTPASIAETPDMDTLHALLGARREALSPGAPVASAATQFASIPELQEALAALQAMPSRHPESGLGTHLTNDLMAELKRNAPGNRDVQLQPEQRDAVDLVSLLYEQLLTETRSEGAAQQLLAGLVVPLLRVAVADNQFFTVRNHPARRLLNTVLETANLWLDRSDGTFDTALNQHLQRSVQRITEGFHGDLDVIEREADELDAHLRLLTRRAEIAERRQVEAAQGRNRLQTARTRARTAINQRLAKRPQTGPLVRAVLEHAWADVLTLTLLREGEHSEAWRRRLAMVNEILEPTPTRDTERLAADLNRGLTQVGLAASEAKQITHHVLDLPPAPVTPDTPAPASQTALLIRLKSRKTPHAETPTAPAQPRKLPLTSSERKALAKLQTLPFGSWLEFTVNQQRQTIARKLAWYSPLTGRCLLVNVRGTAAPERTLEPIARLMARGQVRPMAESDGGMIDRAWHALVSGLRKFGRTQAPQEAVS